MKLIRIISLVFIFFGLCFKMLYWPFSDILFLLGILIMVLHGVIFFIKNSKKRLVDSLFQIALSSWLISIVFCIFYWSQGPRLFGGLSVILLIPILLSILFIAFHFIKEKPFNKVSIFQLAFIAFAFWFCTMPSYQIYYIFNLTDTFSSESKKTNFPVWDKYSWLLHCHGMKQEALIANTMATETLGRFREEEGRIKRKYWNTDYAYRLIRDNRIKIENGEWKRFHRITREKVDRMNRKHGRIREDNEPNLDCLD